MTQRSSLSYDVQRAADGVMAVMRGDGEWTAEGGTNAVESVSSVRRDSDS
ncbi:MAG: hypothetical protein FWH04_05375 [Oscillospiraceae bacterium]|nr:hypothetical protein [Oscillospiraceae bacterium]